MFTDIHTHAFHPKICRQAVAALNAEYDINCVGDGTTDDMLRRARAAGIDRCVVLCAATTGEQVVPANNFAMSLNREHPDEITAFGTIHPDYADWEAELARMKENGIRGIKLHPDLQHFRLDDPRLLPIFDAAQDDFIFLLHIGSVCEPAESPSCPYKMAAILKRFPRLRAVSAHLGGYRQWKHSMESLVGKPVWLDTSSCSPFLPPEMLRTMLRRHPQEYLLFGSDYPVYDPNEEIERLQRQGDVSDSSLERYMRNVEALLNS